MALVGIVLMCIVIFLSVLIYFVADKVGHFASKIIKFLKEEENE